jgi:hypothetical protein
MAPTMTRKWQVKYEIAGASLINLKQASLRPRVTAFENKSRIAHA